MARIGVLLLCVLAACRASVVRVTDRDDARGPRVLAVIAHPDDETAFAAALYKITTFLDGACDLAVITNGEGGFKYSTLAERIYGCELTDEAVGRARLPAIRKRELRESASILGVRDVFFLDQRDHRYTLDVDEVLGAGASVWDLALVRRRLEERLARGQYDFVFTLLPTPDTHAHHKAATILALEVLDALPDAARPIALGARVVSTRDDDAPEALPEFPATELDRANGPYAFERTQKFGHQDKLDYRIVVNWVIAAHKSQGTMQLYANQGEREEFWLFAGNASGAAQRAGALFESLRRPQFAPREYAASER